MPDINVTDMLSNPVQFWPNGHTRIGFKYEGGSRLWNFVFHKTRKDGHGGIVLASGLLWADDEDQAKAILRDMCRFMIGSAEQQMKDKNQHPGIRSRDQYSIEKANEMLAMMEADDFILREPPKHQIMKVAWASNDTF